MNNKGFTLVEALAVIVVLGLVLSIGGYSVANYLNDSRDKSLHVFKENIKSGMINYYNECKYLKTGVCSDITIENISDGDKIISHKLSTTIGSLAENGFIENQGNDEETESTLKINNPLDEKEELTYCEVSITYNNDKHSDSDKKEKFEDVDYGENCGSLKNINN